MFNVLISYQTLIVNIFEVCRNYKKITYIDLHSKNQNQNVFDLLFNIDVYARRASLAWPLDA